MEVIQGTLAASQNELAAHKEKLIKYETELVDLSNAADKVDSHHRSFRERKANTHMADIIFSIPSSQMYMCELCATTCHSCSSGYISSCGFRGGLNFLLGAI
jgi:hypothetical protein